MTSPKISFPGKKHRNTSLLGHLWTDDGHSIFVGKNWALQNDIDDNKIETKNRSCYRECRTCGSCANSIRDGATCSSQYDEYAGRMIHCRMCERFRFCDCRNGFFRNAHGEAEPFTPDVVELMRKSNGKPLI